MKAMIFAAGLGTRLRPLTDTVPKALIKINGKTLLEITVNKLVEAGVDGIVVNVHHFPQQIKEFLHQNNLGIQIDISDESDFLLDTGGGLRRAARFFQDGEPFIVHNVDILSNIDLKSLYSQHCKNDVLATLAVGRRPSSRYFLWDSDLRLRGWKNEKTGEVRPSDLQKREELVKLAFAGIHIISPSIFALMNGFPARFSITDFYLTVCEKEKICAFAPDNFKMIDAGKMETLAEAELFAGQYL